MRLRFANFGLPMFAKDLVELAQRRQTYVTRVSFAVLLFLLSGLVFVPTYLMARVKALSILGSGAELLNALYGLEWFGLCLFVPAIVSGALAAEKERNTLQLLFLTRLGPWTILVEKLLSRLIPVATLLFVSLPILMIVYLLGGVSGQDVNFAALGLVATAFQVACLSLFCSAYCATSASAFVMSYVILVILYVAPYLGLAAYVTVETWRRNLHNLALAAFMDTPQMLATWEAISSISGVDRRWLMFQFFSVGTVVQPFHRSVVPFAAMISSGLFFVLLARVVVVRRAAPQPQYRLRRLFRRIDGVFRQINNRIGRGIEFGRGDGGLPDERPIAWRESRRGNLGRMNYLIRILFLIELPILIPTVLYVMTTRNTLFGALALPVLLLWSTALLVVFVRSAGLIAAEKARQTLDVLLVTPLSLWVLVGQKWRGLWPVMAVVSGPILLNAVIEGYLQTASGGPRFAFYAQQGFDQRNTLAYVLVVAANLVILLALAAQLAFLFGLLAKTQARATMAALGLFVIWSMLPLMLRAFWNYSPLILYYSPLGAFAANEFPEFGVLRTSYNGWQTEAGPGTFYLLAHWALYAMIAGLIALINFRVARRVLVRPPIPGTAESKVECPMSKVGIGQT
jgi:ABC-type transport system involved in multi-copper enzyme maturation permease subunit